MTESNKNHWEQKVVNIGTIKENQKVLVVFKTKEDISDVVLEFSPRCGSCTIIEKYEDNKLEVKYKASTIPYHLGISNQPINKFIDVYYKDGSVDTLEIKGEILNKFNLTD